MDIRIIFSATLVGILMRGVEISMQHTTVHSTSWQSLFDIVWSFAQYALRVSWCQKNRHNMESIHTHTQEELLLLGKIYLRTPRCCLVPRICPRGKIELMLPGSTGDRRGGHCTRRKSRSLRYHTSKRITILCARGP